jgi:hypothetical protein
MLQVSRWYVFIPTLLALSHIKYFCQRKGREPPLGKPRHCWETSIKINLKRWDANSKFKCFYRETTSRRFLSSDSMGGIILPLDHFWGNAMFRAVGCWLKFTVDHFGNMSVHWEQKWPSHVLCIQYAVVNMTDLYSLCTFKVPKPNAFFYAFLL